MKPIFYLLLLITLVAHGQDYDKQWSRVIEFENQGRTASANKETKRILKMAVRDANEVQIIKCFFYHSKFLLTLEEDAQQKILDHLNENIASVSAPSKAILEVVKARCLERYRDQNRHRIFSRSRLDTIDELAHWPMKTLEDEIAKAYEKSLSHREILKKTPLSRYEQIFDFLSTERFNNQNLYGYILSENIRYRTATLNSYEQITAVNIADLFSGSAEFTQLNLPAAEKISAILNLYQELERNDSSGENQLERLTFVHTRFIHDESMHIHALESIQKNVVDTRLRQDIQLAKAEIYLKRASKDKSPQDNTKALKLLDSILVVDNRSNAWQLARIKKHNLISKTLMVQISGIVSPGKRSRAFINFRNVDSVLVQYYKINTRVVDSLHKFSNDGPVLESILKSEPYASFRQPLPDQYDFFGRTTEILLPALDKGSYLAYFKAIGSNPEELPVAYEVVTSTDLMLTKTEDEFKVLHRETGVALSGVKLETTDANGVSDQNGRVKLVTNNQNNYGDTWVRLTKAGDTLFVPSHRWYNYRSVDFDPDEIDAKVSFFLDRGIYRPGQKMQYKGIVVQRQNGKVRVCDKLTFKILIEDPNGEELQSSMVTTNDMGSFWGEFVIPKNGLTGQFRIIAEEPDEEEIENDPKYDRKNDEHPFWDYVSDWDSSIYFRVEEYKRPKFEIAFDNIKNSYRPSDTFIVTGTVRAFSGAGMSGAKVRYWVKSTKEGESKSMEGETMAGASGKFSIPVGPGYIDEDATTGYYQVKVSVTDLDGETHELSTYPTVGARAFHLTASIPEKLGLKERPEMRFSAQNLNGQPVDAAVAVKIYHISGYENKFKPRLFETPEISMISQDAFLLHFPYEKVVGPERLPEKPVADLTVQTNKTKTIPMDFLAGQPVGYYRAVFSAKDQWGNDIFTQQDFQFVPENSFVPDQALTLVPQKNNVKKDGFITVAIYSPVKQLHATVQAIFENRAIYSQEITLDNHRAIVKVPVGARDTGTVLVKADAVFDGALFGQTIDIQVQGEASDYTITAESFRSKIEPGSHEKWSFNVSPKLGMSQEVLATMYDVSLDKLALSRWPTLDFDRSYNYPPHVTVVGNFTGYAKNHRFTEYLQSPELKIEKTSLIWFGFDFAGQPTTATLKKYKDQRTRKLRKPASATMITGVVSDQTGTLPGANVVVKGTARGVQTDIDGYFEIEAAPGEELIFSFVGFSDTSITVGQDKKLTIQLNDNGTRLEEVVVEGFATKTNKSSVVAQSTVVGADLAQTLQGRVAGLDIERDSTGTATKVVIRGMGSINGAMNPLLVIDGVVTDAKTLGELNPDDIVSASVLKDASAKALYGSRAVNGVLIVTTKKAMANLDQVKTRTNLSETAFFFPDLKVEKSGKFQLNFTSPEALTQWKLRLFAHDKNGTNGYLQSIITTQKDLMTIPNFPRFFREKDTVYVTAKIANMTGENKSGVARLLFHEAASGDKIDTILLESDVKPFTVEAFKSTIATWKIVVPEGISGLQYKVVAQSGIFSDGEENIIPVLTNNMLVTETIPLWVTPGNKRTYRFENLVNNKSATLRNHQVTVAYTSNPTWLAIESLPYLMEYEHECSEQTFARYYANTLAAQILESNPKIAALISGWNTGAAKPEEKESLKSILLAETPWLNDVADEKSQKQRLALLLDLDKMKTARTATWEKLTRKQSSSGGFSWFEGGPESEYITRHIVAGLGHLRKLAPDLIEKATFNSLVSKAIGYLDQQFLLRQASKQYVNQEELHFLYARSFFMEDYKPSATLTKKMALAIAQVQSRKFEYNLSSKAMAALVLHRFGKSPDAKDIIRNFRETSVQNQDNGMYWMANKESWYWHEMPIETQALIIEAFQELGSTSQEIDAMKTWLLKKKQQKNWPTTKATTEAIYALLLTGTDWLAVKDNTIITIGDEKIKTRKLSETEKEAETGYVKLTWKGNEINASTAALTIENKSKVPGYGGFYWQYFEDLDKVQTAPGALNVAKTCYLKVSDAEGEKLEKITAQNPLKIGDRITVRLLIKAENDMEFVHLKDMRASCFEPVDVLSGYRWRDGLGFYQSTRDAATHFFFDRIGKGTYVLEYDLHVTNAGYFSNGITTIQNMYAPEFSSHTKGETYAVKP